jgi:hypothetical protein
MSRHAETASGSGKLGLDQATAELLAGNRDGIEQRASIMSASKAASQRRLSERAGEQCETMRAGTVPCDVNACRGCQRTAATERRRL